MASIATSPTLIDSVGATNGDGGVFLASSSPSPSPLPVPALEFPSPSSSPPAASGVPPASPFIALSLGSCFLRYGFCDDFQPRIKPAIVAFRRTATHSDPVKAESKEEHRASNGNKSWIVDPESELSADDRSALHEWRATGVSEYERLRSELVKKRVKPPPKPKFFDDSESVIVYEAGSANIRVDVAVDDTRWTNTDAHQQYFTGDDAANLSPFANYDIRYPIRRGRFNIHDSNTPRAPLSSSQRDYDIDRVSGMSLAGVKNCLSLLFLDSFINDLKIPRSQLAHYCVSLACPDTLTQWELMHLTDVLLADVGVKELILHRQSLATCYGCGATNACVVDIGGQVTTIACVIDGQMLPQSSLSLNYGGDDLTAALLSFMQSHDHYRPSFLASIPCTPHFPHYWRQLTNIKERVVVCPPREHHYQSLELREYHRDGSATWHRMNVSTAAIIAPRALLLTSLLPSYVTAYSLLYRTDTHLPYDWMEDQFMQDSVYYYYTQQFAQLDEKPTRAAWKQVGLLPSVTGVSGGGSAGVSEEPKAKEEVPDDSGATTVTASGAAIATGTTTAIASGATAATATGRGKKRRVDATNPSNPSSAVATPTPGQSNSPVPGQPLAPASAPPAPAIATATAVVAAAAPPAIPLKQQQSAWRAVIKRQTQDIDSQPSYKRWAAHRIGLPAAIAQCLKAMPSVGQRRLLCKHILLTGGSCLIEGFHRDFTRKLIAELPLLMPETLEGYDSKRSSSPFDEVDTIFSPKLIRSGDLAWKGAALIACIRNEGVNTVPNDAWITRDDWQRKGKGVRMLREKVPFLW